MNKHVKHKMTIPIVGIQSELRRAIKSFLILCMLSFYVSASAASAQSVNVRITLNNPTIAHVIEELYQQTGYEFSYDASLLSEKLSDIAINAKNEHIESVLSRIFSQSDISFKVMNNRVFLKSNKATETSAIQSANVRQQPTSKTISGIVKDDMGEPIIGATVVEKNNPTRGTITDIDGNFTLRNVPENATLQFTYVGMKPQEIAVNGRTTINIILESDTELLDELIVVGYGSQRAGEITGAISTISASKFADLPVVQASTILKGLGSGVTSVQSNVPGGGATIRIRGLGTINNNDPLWVVDGVPGASAVPEDIESITILKDASSQAIYGARAANGVILVTTKSGKKNQQLNVNFSVRSGVSKNISSYNLMNTMEVGEWYWLAAKNQGIANYSHPLYGNGEKPDIPDYIFPARAQNVDHSLYDNLMVHEDGTDTYLITKANKEGTDWLDYITRNAFLQQYSLGITGGTQNSRYGLSLNYTNEEGILKHTSFDRFGLRFNYSANINDWLEIGEFFNIRQTNNKGDMSNNGVHTSMSEVYRMQPIIPVYDVAGNHAGTLVPGTGNSPSPAFRLWSNRFDNTSALVATGNVFLNASYKDFSFKSLVGFNLNHSNTRDLNYNEVAKAERGMYDRLIESNSDTKQYNWTNSIGYAKTFNKHTINALLGSEIVRYKSRNLSGSRSDFFFKDPNYMQLSVGERDISNSGNINEWSLISQFGRLNYNYEDKYLFQGTLRRDGSSRFGPENRHGIFPAFSAGWRISQESFMASSSRWLTDLKIRAGWGQTGNDQIGNYNSFSTFRSNPNSSYYPISGSNSSATSGFIASSIGNSATSWESTTTTNVGADLILFNKLYLTLDIWNRNTSNMLYPKKIPAVRGSATAPSINIGDMQNRGFDFELSYFGKAHNNKIEYDFSLNVSHYKNKITRLSNTAGEFLSGTGTRAEEGRSFPEFYGLIIDGIFQTQEEVDNHPTAFGSYNQLGNWKFRNTNDDDVINDDDRTYIGSPHPDFTAGLTINLKYKKVRLSSFLYSSYGNDIFNSTLTYIDYSYWEGNKRKKPLYESWGSPYLKDNRDATMAKVMFSDVDSRRASTYFVEDGSYLRMENLLFGYDLSGFIPFVNKMEVFVQGTNLFTWTKYSGLDPQIGRGGMGMGVDEGAWPTPRQFLVGFGITF